MDWQPSGRILCFKGLVCPRTDVHHQPRVGHFEICHLELKNFFHPCTGEDRDDRGPDQGIKGVQAPGLEAIGTEQPWQLVAPDNA